MSVPLFSIITICYNPGPPVLEAIASVREQKGPRFEHIVIDGASCDGTLDRLQHIDPPLDRLISEPDKGLYDALNKGIAQSSGEIIGFLHADDLLADCGALASVARAFSESGADGVYGDLEYVHKFNPARVIRFWRSGAYTRTLLPRGWMPPHPSLYLRRGVYEQARLANGEWFDTRYRISSDYDFMLRILWKMRVKIFYLPRVLVRMRVGGASNCSLRNLVIKSKEDYQVLRKNGVGGIRALFLKNICKAPQFVLRRRASELEHVAPVAAGDPWI